MCIFQLPQIFLLYDAVVVSEVPEKPLIDPSERQIFSQKEKFS